jgi:formate hydrogenlyase subunit 6/NADH:ubiquinone oxidoreductase subunit I
MLHGPVIHMSMIKSSLRNLVSRPYTVRYPYEDTHIPANNRGRVVWDMQKCIWCHLCEKNCPTKAITTDKQAKTQTIVRVRCIQCRLCADICPKKTITMEARYSSPGEHREVHTYHQGTEPFIYEVSSVPDSERDGSRLRKRKDPSDDRL